MLLIPAAVSTKDFHDIILPNAEVRFLRGRVTFVPPELPRNATNKEISAFNKSKGRKSTKGKHDSMIVIFRRK